MTTYLKTDNEVFQVRNESITVNSTFRFDSETNEKVFDEKLDNAAINKAFAVYREQNNILNKNQIKKVREKYDLSQRTFAKLIGWSPATIARYEQGALPSKTNNAILIGLRDGQEMAESFFTQNQYVLNEDERNHFLKRMSELKEKANNQALVELIENRFQEKEISIFTGYTKFNYEKFRQMVLFFATKIPYLSKTKLNKLLFYSDFQCFKQTTVSLSGMTYKHDYYGPVPEESKLIYPALEESNDIEFKPFPSFSGEQIVAMKPFDDSLFTKQEIDLLERVFKSFKNDNAEEISRKSHEEKAYSETEMKEVISYQYGLELKSI